MNNSSDRIETRAVHAGGAPDPATGAIMPPIHFSTNFQRDEEGMCPGGFVYARAGNPNRNALETCLADLEGGEAAACFASGNAAAAAVFQALSPSDHVVIAKDVYFGTATLLRDVFDRWKLGVTFVEADNPANIAEAMRPNTKLVWIESPSNPLLAVVDIAAAAEIAHRGGAILVAENTLATPVGQRPFEFGADLVVHSLTKFLGGHSDLLGGAVISRKNDDFFSSIRSVQILSGGILAPFDSWLLLRSIRSLPYRFRAHSENGMKVARFLAGHKRVGTVYYPGLPEHPGHDIARRQMTMFGGVLSFTVKGTHEDARAIPPRTRLFTHATSIGGVESLIEHRASAEGPGTRAPENLIRLSVGLEHPDDLIADLAQALGDVDIPTPKPLFPGGMVIPSPR